MGQKTLRLDLPKAIQDAEEPSRVNDLRSAVRDLLPCLLRPLLEISVLHVSSATNDKHGAFRVGHPPCTACTPWTRPWNAGSTDATTRPGIEEQVLVRFLKGLV